MHKDSLYSFILYVLLQEGKSNILFRLEALFLGKSYAIRHFFRRQFEGCDLPSFWNLKERFEKEHPQFSVPISEEDIVKDDNGLMTGRLKQLG